MAYTSQSIDNLKAMVNIVDVISRVVPLKKAGNSYKGLCPFHHEKTASFVVSEDRQFFHCFGCDAKGDVITFVQKYYNLDFNGAVEMLARDYGVELEQTRGSGENLSEYYKINKIAAVFFYKALTGAKNSGYEYLKGRGLSDDTIKCFGLGYADPEWDSLYRYMKKRGIPEDKLVKVGLVHESGGKYYDAFRNRVMFPIFSASGNVIGFGGRAVAPDDNPKYLNSPESAIFRKKNNLFGLNLSKSYVSRERFIILVEGYMDVIGLYQGGVRNVCASLGTALTENQARLISRYTKKVILSYDSDDAGIKAALRGTDVLKGCGLDVRVMNVTDGKDPDEFIKKEGRDAYLELVKKAVPGVEYKIKRIKSGYDTESTEGKIGCLKEITSYLKTLDPVEADVYVRKISSDLDVSELALRSELYGNEGKQASGRPQNAGAGSRREKETLTEIEKEILRLITREDSFAERAAGEKNIFTTGIGKSVFGALRGDIAANGTLDVSRVLDSLDGDERDCLDDVLRNVPATGDGEKIFAECVNRAAIASLEREQKEIMASIEMADSAEIGQKELQAQLRKLSELRAEIMKLKAKGM